MAAQQSYYDRVIKFKQWKTEAWSLLGFESESDDDPWDPDPALCIVFQQIA